MVEKPVEALQRLRERRTAVTDAARKVSAEIAAEVEARRVGPDGLVLGGEQ